MKTFIITVGILLGIVTTSAQEIKSTIGERITKYIPVMEPKPCSIFLVDYGSKVETTQLWTKKLGLVPAEIMNPTDTTQYVLQYLDPDNPNVIYGFIHRKNTNIYMGGFCFIKFKSPLVAIEELEKLKTQLYLYWGNRDKEKTNAKSVCNDDNTNRFITISRTNEGLMITHFSLTHMLQK